MGEGLRAPLLLEHELHRGGVAEIDANGRLDDLAIQLDLRDRYPVDELEASLVLVDDARRSNGNRLAEAAHRSRRPDVALRRAARPRAGSRRDPQEPEAEEAEDASQAEDDEESPFHRVLIACFDFAPLTSRSSSGGTSMS